MTPFSPNGVKKPRPNRLRQLYITLRRLVRRRQESAELKAVRKACQKSIEIAVDDCDQRDREAELKVKEVLADTAKEVRAMAEKIDAKNREVESLRDLIRSRDKRIADLTEVELPKVRNELEVEREYSKHLATLEKKKLLQEEAEIAVLNQRIAAAESLLSAAQGSVPSRS